MSEENKYIFFYGGPFSQWYRSKFVIDGIEYNCCEQYMMAEKARLFGDTLMLEKIMDSNEPRYQKSYGRMVSNYDDDVWHNVAKDVVYRGNMAKFTQNEELKTYILFSGGRTIVEASPFDKYWGIGLGVDHPDRYDETKWRGQNWLGKQLMRVRDEIRTFD